MRVALIIAHIATGGFELYLRKRLTNIDRCRMQPTVIFLMKKGEIGSRIEVLGVPVHARGMRRGLHNPWMVVQLLRRLPSDVVHIWMCRADLLGAWMRGWRVAAG